MTIRKIYVGWHKHWAQPVNADVYYLTELRLEPDMRWASVGEVDYPVILTGAASQVDNPHDIWFCWEPADLSQQQIKDRRERIDKYVRKSSAVSFKPRE